MPSNTASLSHYYRYAHQLCTWYTSALLVVPMMVRLEGLSWISLKFALHRFWGNIELGEPSNFLTAAHHSQHSKSRM